MLTSSPFVYVVINLRGTFFIQYSRIECCCQSVHRFVLSSAREPANPKEGGRNKKLNITFEAVLAITLERDKLCKFANLFCNRQ